MLLDKIRAFSQYRKGWRPLMEISRRRFHGPESQLTTFPPVKCSLCTRGKAVGGATRTRSNRAMRRRVRKPRTRRLAGRTKFEGPEHHQTSRCSSGSARSGRLRRSASRRTHAWTLARPRGDSPRDLARPPNRAVAQEGNLPPVRRPQRTHQRRLMVGEGCRDFILGVDDL